VCYDLQTVVICIEDDELATRLRFVGQCNRQSAKGTLQLDKTDGELDVHRAIRRKTTLNLTHT